MAMMMFPGPMELLMILLMSGGMGMPLGLPPGPEDPLLANVAPEQCLFYTSWAGTVAPDPASPNQTEQLLAEPELQQAFLAIEKAIEKAMGNGTGRQDADADALADIALNTGKRLLQCPGAIFVSELNIQPGGPPDVRGAAILRIGKEEGEKLKAALEKQQAALPAGSVEQVEIAGETWHRIVLPPAAVTVTWGVKASYLIVGLGEGSVEGVLQRAKNTPPQWLAHLRATLLVERPSTCTYANVEAIREMVAEAGGPEVAGMVQAIGLGNVKSIASVTGLEGEGFVSRNLLAIDGDPQGIFALAAGEPLTAADLDAIPEDSTFAAAVRLDLEKVLDFAMQVSTQAGERDVEQGMAELERMLNVKLREDLLGPLGDRWQIYGSPSEAGIVPLGVVAVTSVDDHAALASAHAKLLAFVNAQLAAEPAFGRRANPRIVQFEHAGHAVHFFDARRDDMWVAPAWCLTEKELIVSLFPQGIKAYLSRSAETRSLGQSDAVAAEFGSTGGPTALAYVDTKRVFELIYPAIPMVAQAMLGQMARQGIDLDMSFIPSAPSISRHLRPSVATVRRTPGGILLESRQTLPGGSIGPVLPLAIGLGMPAVSSSRQAARRAQSMNNMKQIALSMFNYEAMHGHFPPAYVADKDGKPLLSWRVLILPYLEQNHLYEQFKLDEPWDSEHNRRLANAVPLVYRSPASKAAPGMANYLTVRGDKTAFPGEKGQRFADFRDGTSNTIMAVEVDDARAVPWTKPDDFPHNEEQPAAGLGGLWDNGFLAAMCDGSVRFIRATIAPRTLNALFTRADGEVVDQHEW